MTNCFLKVSFYQRLIHHHPNFSIIDLWNYTQLNCRILNTKLMVKIWSFPPQKYQFRLSVIGYHQCYSWGLGYKESKTCIIFAVRISHSQWSEPSDIYPGHYTAGVSKNLRSIDKFNIKVGYEMKVLTSMGMPDTNFRNCSFCSN